MSSFVRLSLFIGAGIPSPVPAELIDAVESVNVKASTSSASGFQLTFKLPKRSPLHTLFLLSSGSPIPLVRVVIAVTVLGTTTVLMDGVMTEHRVAPGSEPGMSQLTVSGEDLSAAMKYIDWTGKIAYPGMPAEARVYLSIAKYAAFGIVPLVIPQLFPETQLPTEKIPTHQGTDFDYLTMLAKEAGYVFYVDPGPAVGMSTAYWGPEMRLGIPQAPLNVDFDAHTNVESLSFDYNTDDASLPVVYIQEENSKVNIPIPIPDISILRPPLGLIPPIPKRLTRLPEGTGKLNPVRAVLMGLGEASRTQDAVKGTGSLDVRRYGRVLKSRGLVWVRGAGAAFDGLHYVDSVTHDLRRGEYKQSFTLKRDGLLSTVPAATF